MSGTAVDAAGVGALTVAGQPVRVGAGGAFSATVALGAPGGSTAIPVVARDGAGNQSSLTATVVRATPAVAASVAGAGQPVPAATSGGAKAVAPSRPAVRGLSVSLRRGRLTVRFTLAVRSAVRVELLRQRKVARRTRFVRVGRSLTRTLAAGRRSLTLAAPKAGTYRVRVTATAGGRSAIALRRLVVRAR